MCCQIDRAAAGTYAKRRSVLSHWFDSVGDLVLRALFQFVQKLVAHRRGIKPGWAKVIEINVAVLQRQQLTLPRIGNRALLGQERPRAELKCNGAEFGIVDPIDPLAEIPNPAGHEDRRLGEPEIHHQAAQLANSRIWPFTPPPTLAVRQPPITTPPPGALVHHTPPPNPTNLVRGVPSNPQNTNPPHQQE